ncbi:MAG: hypothetical protein E7177_05290 [Erysipelotrichaceae bacterium]|nr:hypothetical protein [Erysipelotrichaceae bacterium]
MKTFFKKLIFFVCFFLIGILFVACSNLPGGSSSEPNNPTNPPSSSEKEDNGEHVCNFKLMKEVPSNCKEEGILYYECECGKSKEERLGFGDHQFTEWYVVDEPTHESEGMEERYCEVCTILESRSIPKLEGGENENPENPDIPVHKHKYEYEMIDEKNHRAYCPTCGDEYIEEHKINAELGYTDCRYCDYDMKDNQTHEHDWVDCGMSDDDYHYSYCPSCGETTNPQPHEWIEEIYFPADCLNSGTKYIYCSVCGNGHEELYFGDHSYGYGEYNDEYHISVCWLCGESDENAKFEHNFTYETKLIPTYNTEGIKEGTCQDCGFKKEFPIPTSEHTCSLMEYGTFPATCLEPEYKLYICRTGICTYEEKEYIGQVIGPHSCTSKVLEPATCTEKGLREYTCTYGCGHTYTEEIDYLSHSYDDNKLCVDCSRNQRLDYLTFVDYGDYYVITDVDYYYFSTFYDKVSENSSYYSVTFPAVYEGKPVKRVSLNINNNSYYRIYERDLVLEEGIEEFYISNTFTSWNSNIYLPKSIKLIGGTPFNYERYYGVSVYYAGSIEDWMKVELEASSSLPTREHFYCVNEEGNYCDVTSITIGSDVTSINGFIFSRMMSLKTLIVPNSVTSIGPLFIDYCENLETLEVPFIGADSIDVWSLDSFASYGTLINLKSITVHGGKTADISNCYLLEYADLGGVTGNIIATGCSNLKELVLPQGMTEIVDFAFNGCASLESLEFPNTIESIGENAFRMCRNLTSLTFQEGIISIGNYAFEYCEKLEVLKIPDTVETIGSNFINSCTALKELYLPDNLKTIAKEFSYDNYELTKLSLTLPTEVEYSKLYELVGYNTARKIVELEVRTEMDDIPESFFENFAYAEIIKLPTTEFDSIGSRAFYGCSRLKELPVTRANSIGNSAFESCNSIESVNIVITSTNVGTNIFKECNSLVDAAVSRLADSMFYDCDVLEKVSIFNPITSIPSRCFQYCSSLDEFDFSSIYDVGDYAFFGSSISYIRLVNNGSIGAFAFGNLGEDIYVRIEQPMEVNYLAFSSQYSDQVSKIKYLYINGSVNWVNKTYGNHLIYDSLTLLGEEITTEFDSYTCKELTISSSVKTIKTGSLTYLTNVKELKIPVGIETIENNSLPNYLTSLTMPQGYVINNLSAYARYHIQYVLVTDSTEVIDNQFYNLGALEIVEYSNSITSIGSNAFKDCKALTTLPHFKEVTSYYSNSFINCESLEAISLPNRNLEMIYNSINSNPFSGCKSLTSLTLGNFSPNLVINKNTGSLAKTLKYISISGNTNITNTMLSNMYALEEVHLGSGVNVIKNSAFSGCISLSNITMEEVTTIESYAFADCISLETLIIPETMESIVESAFERCYHLYQVINLSDVEIKKNGEKGQQIPYLVNEFKTIDSELKEVKRKDGFEYLYDINKDMYTIVCYYGEGGEVVLPSDIEDEKFYIGYRAFEKHALFNYLSNETITNITGDITSIKFSYGVEGIYDYVLQNSTPTKLTINKIFDNLGKAYYGNNNDNKSIVTLELLYGPEIIPDGAFEVFGKLETLIIPSSVTSIGNCIYNEKYLVEVVNESNCELPFNNVINEYSSLEDYSSNIVYEGYLKFVYSLSEERYYIYDSTIPSYTRLDITIPGLFNGKEVVIGKSGLSGLYFNNLVIEEGVKEIKGQGLYNINVSETLTLPHSLEKINANGLYGDFINLNLPQLSNLLDGNIGIRYAENIYYNGTKEQYLTNVVKLGKENTEVLNFQSGVVSLYVLGNNQYELVTSFDLSSKNITVIPKNAFKNIISITDIILPSTINKIGDAAFYNCENLTSINLPEGLIEIGYSAFSYTNISTIKLPSTLITINDYAFTGSELMSIEIPSSVEYLGNHVFGSTNLISVEIPSNVEYLGSYAFGYCEKLTNVVIKEGLEIIKDRTFINCPITYLELPTSVNTIGCEAFAECELGTIDLSNVKTIEQHAFRNNKNLSTIYLSTKCRSIGNYWITSSYNQNKITIIYSGTETEFNNYIAKGQYWNSGFDSTNLEIKYTQE